MSARHPLLVPAALVGALVAISFGAPLFLAAQPTHPLVAAGLRLALASLLLFPFTRRAARRGGLDKRQFRLAALAGVFYALHFGAWVTSLSLTSVAASVTLVTATPLLLAVVGVVTGRDRPRPRLWIALGLALGGLLLIGGADLAAPGALTGDLLALLGAAAIAVYFLLARGAAAGAETPPNPLAFSGVACAIGAVLLLGSAFALGVPVMAAPGTMLYLVFAAAVPQIIGHTLLTWSLRHVGPPAVAMTTVGEPVGATLLAWAWLGQAPSHQVLLGGAVTILAVVVALSAAAQNRPPAVEAT